jgi:hypothetical protein
MFDVYASSDYLTSSSVTATADSSLVGHGPALAADNDKLTWFGSASSGSSASLELDVGSAGPYYVDLKNITVFNRWACQMLQAAPACAWTWRAALRSLPYARACLAKHLFAPLPCAGRTPARTCCSALAWSCTASWACSWRRSALAAAASLSTCCSTTLRRAHCSAGLPYDSAGCALLSCILGPKLPNLVLQAYIWLLRMSSCMSSSVATVTVLLCCRPPPSPPPGPPPPRCACSCPCGGLLLQLCLGQCACCAPLSASRLCS